MIHLRINPTLKQIAAPCLLTLLLLPCCLLTVEAQADWPYVGGDAGGMRYSTLDRINRRNVKDLQVAWTFHTGGLDPKVNTAIQCTPIVVEDVMYLTSPTTVVFAVEAATGRELWRFDPKRGNKYGGLRNRGVAYWSDGRKNGERRIVFATPDGQMYSLDAHTGKLDPAFGRQGTIELREGIERDLANTVYGVTAAPAIFKDLVILGFSVSEGYVSAPGDVRAYDVRTGKEVWRFHTVPRPGEFGHETWKGDGWKDRGGANAWGGVRVDLKRGIVFAGLGSAAHDFYGGDRGGDNLFANCVIALDARTGKRIWHFQIVRHDLWDYDVPAPPSLVTVNHNGKQVDAVAQASKTGHLFLFDRVTGKPLFDIIEKTVPKSDVPGEQTAEKQIFPVNPPPFVRQEFNESEVTDVSPEARAFVREKMKKLRYGTIFTPPSVQGTVIMPGLHGGGMWSGVAFDPATNLLYVNANDMPWTIYLDPDKPRPGLYAGKGISIFTDQNGFPGSKPPWAKLVAIHLDRGEIKWQVPLGTWPGSDEVQSERYRH